MKMNWLKKTLFSFITLCLLQVALLFGLAVGTSVPALAKETPVTEKPVDVRQASADLKKVDEQPESLTKTIVEKLNLNEPVPDSTKKFFEQVKGNEPIEDTTHPEPYQ